jgi:hypothetical protein
MLTWLDGKQPGACGFAEGAPHEFRIDRGMRADLSNRRAQSAICIREVDGGGQRDFSENERSRVKCATCSRVRGSAGIRQP